MWVLGIEFGTSGRTASAKPFSLSLFLFFNVNVIVEFCVDLGNDQFQTSSLHYNSDLQEPEPGQN